MKNIFITGATGYVGELLAKHLANQGHIVHALCRSVQKAEPLLKHPNIKIFAGDLLETSRIEKAMQDCSEVYHLAAYAKVWDKDPLNFYRMNVEGTENILQAALDIQVQKVVVTSTAGVIGPSINGQEVTENTPQVVPHSTEYEKTKALAEEKTKDFVRKGLQVVTVNPTRVYGPGQLSESNAVTKLIQLYKQKKWKVLPGDGQRIGNYVFVEDIVKGHILAMEHGRNGERYLLGGENASYQEFFDKIGQQTGYMLKLYKFPIGLMMFSARIMLFIANLTGKAPLITPSFVKKYLYDWRVSSQKAQQELGYTITPLSEGIQKTLEWLD